MLKHCTIGSAALIVNPRRHCLDGEAHVRVLGRKQVLRGAARHVDGNECGAVIANWIRKNSYRKIVVRIVAE